MIDKLIDWVAEELIRRENKSFFNGHKKKHKEQIKPVYRFVSVFPDQNMENIADCHHR